MTLGQLLNYINVLEIHLLPSFSGHASKVWVHPCEKYRESRAEESEPTMNRTNTGQENEEEERASVSTLAYFLNSQDKVRCANHLQNVGSLIHNPVADNLLVPY